MRGARTALVLLLLARAWGDLAPVPAQPTEGLSYSSPQGLGARIPGQQEHAGENLLDQEIRRKALKSDNLQLDTVPPEHLTEEDRVLAEKGLRRKLANAILSMQSVLLANAHECQVEDLASAFQNMQDAAVGDLSQRSEFEEAPGGEVGLHSNMLRGMYRLGEIFSFRVTEIAGGSHGAYDATGTHRHSAHYDGLAFDIDTLNNERIRDLAPEALTPFIHEALRWNVREDKILAPTNDPEHHANHIHLEWSESG